MSETLANLYSETRQFPPPEALAADANVTASAYDEAAADRLAFWEKQARRLTWAQEWDQVLDWSNPPFAKWFVGGRLNIAYNCVDRHVEAGHGDKVAIHWEGEPGDSRTITYADLLTSVCQAANTLTELGIRAGDRVAIYLPMIPEAAVAMLACARVGATHRERETDESRAITYGDLLTSVCQAADTLTELGVRAGARVAIFLPMIPEAAVAMLACARVGATHSVVVGGFSVDALSTRIQDADAKLVITADGGYRRGKPSALKPTVDEAVAQCPSIAHVLVVRRTGEDVAWGEKDL